MADLRLDRSILPLLCLVAFFAYFAVLVYSERYQPGETGLDCEFSDEKMHVVAVSPNTPASRAGILAGDIVLAIDERPVRTWEDWRSFRARREPGRTYQFRTRRPEGQFEIAVLLKRHSADPVAPLERKRYVQGGLLVFALLLILRGKHEPVRLIAAWLLASIGTAPLFPDAEMTAVWRGLPSPIGALLWIPQISHLMLLPLFFTFFALLPCPLFNRKWPWAFVWLPPLLVAAWESPRLYEQIYNPPLIQELPAWVRFVIGAGILFYCGGGLTAFYTNYQRSGVQERARFQILIFGSLIGLAPLIPFLAAIFWGTLTQSAFVWFFVSDSYRHALVGLFFFFPLSLVYAILRHHVLLAPTRTNGKAGAAV